jgi:AcrR family transcriptional regulator
VAGSGPRREPILEAMIRVAGRKGYEATSVADVVADAHASRATFYKYFDDKRACFLAAHELASEQILAAAESGCDPGLPWSERAVGALATVVDLFARKPELAGTAIVAVAAAGDEARRRHWAAIGKFARLLERDRETPSHLRLPPNTALMAVSCVVGLLFDELQAGRATELPRLLPELEFALLVPFVGPRAAVGGRGRDALRSGGLPQAAPPSNL